MIAITISAGNIYRYATRVSAMRRHRDCLGATAAPGLAALSIAAIGVDLLTFSDYDPRQTAVYAVSPAWAGAPAKGLPYLLLALLTAAVASLMVAVGSAPFSRILVRASPKGPQ